MKEERGECRSRDKRARWDRGLAPNRRNRRIWDVWPIAKEKEKSKVRGEMKDQLTEKLNPIQQRIAEGMSGIAAFLTENTCGAACWEAREDVCRCKCGGKNHGCMRSPDGKQPQRMAKLDGLHYVLAAVGDGVYAEAKRINESFGKCRHIGNYAYGWDDNDKGAPARVKRATKGQVETWPELKMFRDELFAFRQAHNYSTESAAYFYRNWPYLLWVREDVNVAHNERPSQQRSESGHVARQQEQGCGSAAPAPKDGE